MHFASMGIILRAHSTTLVLLMAGITSAVAQDGVLTPGRTIGDLKFRNSAGAVQNRCTADPPVAAPGTPIRLRNLVGGALAAQGSYAPATPAAGVDLILGSFDINPNVAMTGSSFLISAEDLRFQTGATYRFGSRYVSGVGARFCTDVLPITANPGGTRCDLPECAALVNVKFRFVGSTADLGALDAGTLAPPAICQASFEIVETSAGNLPDVQAKSANVTFPVGQLTGTAYQTIPLLVRGNTEGRLTASCTAPVASGATGFVIIPGTNMTPLSLYHTITAACALSGTPSPAIDVTFDIPVERRAGTIQGRFDLTGYVEENPKVRIGGPGSPFIATPQVDTSNPSGPLSWRLDGVPNDSHPVTAWTLADTRDKFVTFPARDGLNLRVPVVTGTTTDLGATFVARPKELTGQVTVFDFGSADLATLQLGAFSPNESATFKSTCHAEALGNPGLPEWPGPNGFASGIGGISRGRLRGSYNTTTGEASLNYHLLLPGIGTQNSSLDGSQALNTTWDFSALQLKMKPTSDTDETLLVAPGTLLRIDTATLPISEVAPAQSYCFGRTNLTMMVNPSLGSLYQPSVGISGNTSYQVVATGTTPVGSVTGSANRSIPFASRTSSLSLSASLVAGLGYRLSPSVRFVPASATIEAQATFANIPPITVPASGVIPCAGPSDVCVSVGGPTGPYSTLSIDILDASGLATPSYCLASGPATFIAKVNSSSVAKVDYELDPAGTNCTGANAQSLCSASCGANPQYTINVPSLPPGTHKLRVCASDTATCFVPQDFNFEIQNQNLGITCPGAISITLNTGETSLPRSDPRIASLLRATVGGTCGIPPAVSDNAPATFPIGTTSVAFSAPGVGTCSTQVTVQPPQERQLGVRTTRSGMQMLDIYRLSSPNATLTQTVSVGSGFVYAFSPSGDRVAIVAANGSTGVVSLSAGTSTFDFAATTTITTGLGPALAVAWHPSGQFYAVAGSGGASPSLQIIRASGTTLTTIQTVALPVPAGFDLSQSALRALSYSNNGSRLVIAGIGAFQTGFRNLALTVSVNTNGTILTTSWRTAMTTTVNAANREEGHEVAFRGTVTQIATNRQLYQLNATATSWVLLSSRANHDSAFGSAGRVLALTEDAPGGNYRAILIDIPSGSITNGPPYPKGLTKGEITLSADAKSIAVGAQTGVIVYDSSFNQVSRIPDPRAAGLRFRPGT